MPPARRHSCRNESDVIDSCSEGPQPSASHHITLKDEAQHICRLCWGVEGDGDGPLLAPCSCKGSTRYIHAGCLAEWLDLLHSRGLYKKATQCEICLSPWKIEVPTSRLSADGSEDRARPGPRRGLRYTLRHLLTSLLPRRPRDLPFIAYRLWKLWFATMAVKGALKMGAAGMQTGVKIGKSLVAEQSAAVGTFLAAVATWWGTPAAELIWIQVAGAVAFGLASEFLYSVLLGTVCGAVAGMYSGCWDAVTVTAAVARGGTNRIASLVQVGWKALKLARSWLWAGSGQVLRFTIGVGASVNMLR